MIETMNMKYYSLGLATVFFFFLTAFTSEKEIKITVNTQGCEEGAVLSMMEFDGFNFTAFLSEPVKDGKTVFTLPETRPRVYYIGTTTGNMLPIILGSEENVQLTTACASFRNARVSGSPLNKGYSSLKSEIKTFKNSSRTMQRQLLMADGDAKEEEKAIFGMTQIDSQRLQLLDSLKRTQPFLGNVAELNTYLSYQLYGEGFPDELNYFVNMYFNYANWQNSDYQYNPWVFESTKAYAQTLSQVNIPDDQHALALNAVLNKIPKDSRTYKLAYGGVLAGLEAKKHDNFALFAKTFVEEFKEKDPKTSAALAKKIANVSQLMVGGTAPDFTQNTPDGKPLTLSEMRGKVVLIDFWASWCGPCRKENPNVVKVYDEYKDQGFDILSVSLDSNKDRWLSAIAKDNLTWAHVSDLKGWKNEVSQMYGISSIPATILLDREGKIIARNLRGPALEAKLKEVFK